MADSKINFNEKEKDIPLLKKAEAEAEVFFTYSDKTLEHMLTPRHFGILPSPDGQARVIGPCGDTIEIFLKIDDGTIREALFSTDGCDHTIICAEAICELAQTKTVKEAFQINAEKLVAYLGGLPPDHVHCASLAANTMRTALLEYLEKQGQPWKKAYSR